MAWTYQQSTGDLYHGDTFIGTGYSGNGLTREEGRNNADMENVVKKGPIPRGKWKMGVPLKKSKLGPVAIPLTPSNKSTALGRSGFFIHGDNKARNASEGCVILARGIRLELAGSGDHDFVVVS